MGKDGHFLSFLAAVGVSLTKDCCKCLTKFSQGWRGRRCLGQPEFNLLSWGQDLWLSEEFLYIFSVHRTYLIKHLCLQTYQRLLSTF